MIAYQDANGETIKDASNVPIEFKLPNTPSCPVAPAAAYEIVDTNQDLCYDASTELSACPRRNVDTFGQDAQSAGEGPLYTDNGDGTITDLVCHFYRDLSQWSYGSCTFLTHLLYSLLQLQVTGLMWTADPNPRILYTDASTVASGLTTGGHSDWRVPTIKQLFSLISFKGREPLPTGTDLTNAIPYLDDTVFKFVYGGGPVESAPGATCSEDYRLIDAQYITSTEYKSQVMSGVDCFFGVNFADGRIKCYPQNPNRPGSECIKKSFALFVREAPLYGFNTFINNGDKTISDSSTGLMWDQGDSGSGMNWVDALLWVKQRNNRSYRGYSDWRLPNIKELHSIVDYSRSPDTTNSAAIDPLFDVSQITNEARALDYPYFWSSTTHLTAVKPGENAAYISFGRAMGKIGGNWIDVHGAGAQRSDPKDGDPASFPDGFGPQGDAIRIFNYVRLVRGGNISP